MLFNRSKELSEHVGMKIDQEQYKRIDIWKHLYAGYYDDIHKVKVQTIGKGEETRQLKSLKMPKVSTEYLSKLIFTEKIKINISNKSHDENLQKILNDNRFYRVMPGKVEQMFALGGLILKGHPKEQEDGTYKITINYITPDLFIPTSHENEQVTEGIFVNISRDKDIVYYLLEIHEWEWQKNPEWTETSGQEIPKAIKVYKITNKLFEAKDGSQEMKEIPLDIKYPNLQKVVRIENLKYPMFVYLKPAIANNFDLNSPLGISIFANAIDTIQAIDTAFDSFEREFRLGKRRIIVPASSVVTIVDPSTGERTRYFDANDEAYQAMNYEDPTNAKIVDNTVSLRVDEHVAGINALLNLYSMQLGLSNGAFTFDGKGIKTATEIVTEQSGTYQTKQLNENMLEEGLNNFFKSISELAALYDIIELPAKDFEAEFYWDDSIIKDKYTDTDYMIKLKQNDLVSRKYAMMEILDITEEQADEMIAQIDEEKAKAMPAQGMFNVGSNNNGIQVADEDIDDEDMGDVE